MRPLSYVLIAILAAPHGVYGQRIGSIEYRRQHAWVKLENGFIISWNHGVATDSPSSQVDIFDKQGHSVASFSVLPLVPEANSVSIYDVSVRPGQMIAVAAVYANVRNAVAGTLLYLDSRGTLLSALALEPSRQIRALGIDDDLNVWTLALDAGEKDPAQTSMVIEYSRTGKVVGELLSRNLFPSHAQSIQEDPQIGAVAAGYESGVFWFWLPGSTDLVTVRTSDGRITRIQTGLPHPQGRTVIPLQIAREASGMVVADVREEGQNIKPRLAHYAWSPETKLWSGFDPADCQGHRLVGVDGNEHIYVTPDAASDICTFTRQ